MTLAPSPELERKVHQLDSDVQSIYGLLNGIARTQQRHSDRLDDQAARLDEIAGTQQRHGNRLDELAGRLDEIAATQQRHGNRLDGIDGRLDGIDGRLDQILAILRTEKNG